MKNTGDKAVRRQPTFFPYINMGKSGIRIDFSPEVGSLDKEGSAFPFEILDNPDPLVQFVKARLVTDGGSEIEHLIALLQRDQVQLVKNISLPSTNPGINQLWQKAFSNICGNETFEGSLLKLGDQLANNGRLQPFQSLLYCSLKRQFFPPPCPLCGGLLDLCQDDDMLIGKNLHAYTDSLRRYLFCPTCYQLAGETDFYTCLSADQKEVNVKSTAELIQDFKDLVASTAPTHRFPCRDCLEAAECHATNGPAKRRITPFAFYPFHLFIFKANLIETDNLSLLAAAKNTFTTTSSSADRDRLDQVPIQSIGMTLSRVVTNWQLTAAETNVPIDTADSSSPPPSRKPSKPPMDLSIQSPQSNENRDLKETIIVRADRSPSISDLKTDIPVDRVIPETIIVSAERSLQTGNIWPDADTNEKHSSTPPPLDELKKKHAVKRKTDPLPETIIIRPGEVARRKSIDTGPTQPFQTKRPQRKPNDSIEKPFTFNNANNGATRQPDDPSNLPKKFLKTFKLGQAQSPSSPTGDPMASPGGALGKKQKPSPPVADEHLAETIIVKPPPSKKGK